MIVQWKKTFLYKNLLHLHLFILYHLCTILHAISAASLFEIYVFHIFGVFGFGFLLRYTFSDGLLSLVLPKVVLHYIDSLVFMLLITKLL